MITLAIPMKINSEKKHSVRYDAVDGMAAIQSVYLMRRDLPNQNIIPQTLTVKVEFN